MSVVSDMFIVVVVCLSSDIVVDGSVMLRIEVVVRYVDVESFCETSTVVVNWFCKRI